MMEFKGIRWWGKASEVVSGMEALSRWQCVEQGGETEQEEPGKAKSLS